MGAHFRQHYVHPSVVYPVVFRVITRGGEERWLEHICQPAYGSNGNYLARRGSNRDITERRRAEEALKEQAKEIVRKGIRALLEEIENVEATHQVHRGEPSLQPSIAQKVLKELGRPSVRPPTPRSAH